MQSFIEECLESTSESLDVGKVWERIVGGQWAIAEISWIGGRLSVVLRRRRRRAMRRALTSREHQVVSLAAQGRSDKWIAYELGLTRSTVSTHLGKAMGKLGILHRTHLGLLRFLFNPPAGQAEAIGVQVRREAVLSVSFPCSLQPGADVLTPAELAVARLALEGWSNDEIAERREVSPRTVANQLASVYEKHGVNSRTELASSLAG